MLSGWPENKNVVIKSLVKNKFKEITKVGLQGSHTNLSYNHTDNGLIVELPDNKDGLNYTNVLKIK